MTSPNATHNVIRAESAEDVAAIVQAMNTYYDSGATQSVDFRLRALGQLKAYLQANEQEILDALKADLGKTAFESYQTELGLVYDEITFMKKHLKSMARPKRVYTPLAHFPSSSKVYAQPMGTVLVMSPWNYPVLLALTPLVDAIAAGNCVALKPSRTSAATGDMLKRICDALFAPEFVFCFPGSGQMNDWLLDVKFDKLFFTGSPRVGRIVMAAAAKNLSDVTLELGGKSPCIVDDASVVKVAAQRIAWGKLINSGQTCVAPDYFLVREDLVDSLVQQLEQWVHTYYGDDLLNSPDFPHMINSHHFDRVCGLIDNRNPNAQVAFGGGRNPETLTIEPTCMTGVTLDDPVMGEEIFGPVMPIITYKTIDEAVSIVRTFPHPLACYVFSNDTAVQQRIVNDIPFGGGCINDVVVHLANNHMGFGGFGESGLGSYHGQNGFDCFTHKKSVLKKGTWLELPVRTAPGTALKERVIRMLIK